MRVHILVGLSLLFGGLACTPLPSSIPGPPGPAGADAAATGSIAAALVDTNGMPVATAIGTTWPMGLEATSDAQGLATWSSLPIGVYRLTFAAPGFVPVRVENVPVAAGVETRVDVLLEADNGGPIPSLRVLSSKASGSPLVNATVVVDGGAWSALTDANGRAEFFNLPSGDVDVQVLPEADDQALPRSAAPIAIETGVLTELIFRHSGRVPAGSEWLGSEACSGCHPAQAQRHANSGHAHTWQQVPVAGLDLALQNDTMLNLSIADGSAVQVRLFRSAGTDRLSIITPGGTDSFDMVGFYGGNHSGQVPILLTDGGPAPAPIAWRIEGEGDLAAPAFVDGAVAFQIDDWLGPGAALIRHAATGGPAPTSLESAACLGCHAGGFVLSESTGVLRAAALNGSGEPAERGVGCESCHGPGSAHSNAPLDQRADLIVQPGLLDADDADAICAACHSRGSALSSHATTPAYPYSDLGPHLAGDDLATALAPSPQTWANGTASAPNQQSDEFAQSVHADNSTYRLRCVDCHDAHGPRPDGAGGTHRAQLVANADNNDLCMSCHGPLNFPNPGDARTHTAHTAFDPGQLYAAGRCIGCHMPGTADRFGLSAYTGSGSLPSHRFDYVRPQSAVDAFDAAATTTLPLEQVPPTSCLECHRWAEVRYPLLGSNFFGPHGEPTQRQTHADLEAFFLFKFPGAP